MGGCAGLGGAERRDAPTLPRFLVQDSPDPVNRTFFVRGAADALALPAWIVGFSLLGVGSLARDVGHPAGAAVLSTILIWAAPAQVIFYSGLAAGSGLPGLAAAICLSSMRFLPMTLALVPYLRRPGQRVALQWLTAHYVAVTVWVECSHRLPVLEPKARLPYFLGFGNACIGLAAAMTGAGYYLVGTLPAPLAAGLLFITPMFFTLALVAGARVPGDWAAIALGFLLAPLCTRVLGPDFDLLVAGLVGGTMAHLIGLRRAA